MRVGILLLSFLLTGVYRNLPRQEKAELAACFPPQEESVGAKLVFPRKVGEREVASESTQHLTFELLELAGAGSPAAPGGSDRGNLSQTTTATPGVLRATFSAPEMGKVMLC